MRSLKTKVIPGQTCWAIDIVQGDSASVGYMCLHKVIVDTLYFNSNGTIELWLKDFYNSNEWSDSTSDDYVFESQAKALKAFTKLSLIIQKRKDAE